MKAADDELIAHIRESLTAHEEAYAPGAWERFEKKERKGRGLLWLASLGSAAAVLLIGFVLFYTSRVQDKKVRQQAAIKTEQKIETRTSAPVTAVIPETGKTITENLNTPVSENKAVVVQRKNNNVINSPLIVAVQQPLGSKSINTHPPIVTSVKETNPVDSGLIAKTPPKADKPRSFQEFLEAEVKANPQMAQTKTSAKKNDKWEIGVIVAPSIGNSKKLNMGYGLSMAYALSNKVSISSGISYNEMGASKDLTGGAGKTMNSPAEMSSLVTESKSLQSVDANLIGLDIPVEIKYYFTKKLYTNFGLSAFAVLSQKQNNNYLQGTLENRTAEFAGQPGFNTVLTQKAVSEEVPSGEIRNNKYLGFYNISFGYKQKISDKRAFSVEPFMKLPMKEFSKENLYLIGTGVRLKFDF